MASEIVKGRLRIFQSERERLQESRDAEFKPGRAVRVSNARFHGHGLIVQDDGCPVDRLAVKLENGNTWWYPLEDCDTASRNECPEWLRKRIVESKSVVRKLTAQKAI